MEQKNSLPDIISNKVYYRRMVLRILGGFISAAAICLFYYPNKFLSGGLSGIALILDYVFQFPVPLTLIILNIPIFLLAFFILDWHFVIASLISMSSYIFFLHLLEPLAGSLYIPDEILGAIFGGALNGVGMGLVLKNRSSFGGTDILSAIAKRKWAVNLGTSLFFFNLIVVATGVFFFQPYKGMYSLIGMFISSTVIDRIVKGFEKRYSLFIISREYEQVYQQILDLELGATLLDGEGAYEHGKRKVILSVIPSHRLSKLKDMIYIIDPEAFVTVSPSSEIMGYWYPGVFKRKRVYHKED
ncbi:MAG: YitT family protein [Spirochaetales bacterium]|nr:YitT family protein [Spirochaetales bacterium]